ncbi:hypothetical protein LSTR_LSTR004572 [Laodelphax striatellus]|uniref:Uncharacterized protein n=1 Tax=Laodelphax striatellus TaxID=195883 RepID=A0A482WTP7_LAOST|nr:hypothetical protein LSTR_LSTR004572 [Laodelphax striatellus]
MESFEMEQLIQRTPMSSNSTSEQVDCNISQKNTTRCDFQSGQSQDRDSAIESHQSSCNSSISTDLATESIYHNIIKQRNLSTCDIQPAKLLDERKLEDCHESVKFGYQGTTVTSGDFPAVECVHQDDDPKKEYIDRNNQQVEESNGDIVSQKSDYFSQDSAIDEDVEDSSTIRLKQLPRDGMNSNGDNKSQVEKEEKHSDQNSSSLIDTAYTCIMNRYGGFRHFNPDQFSENTFRSRNVSYAWNAEDDTSTHLTKSDSIRNLLEAMHSMGVNLNIPEDQPPDTSAQLNNSETLNEPLSKGASEVNENSRFREHNSSNFQSNTDKLTKSQDPGISNPEASEMIHDSIQKLLLQDLQKTGCLDEDSARALEETVGEFSDWISKLVTENEKLRKSMEGEKSDDKPQNQKSNLPSPQSVPDNLIRSMLNSENTKNRNLEESGMMGNEKLLEQDLQTAAKSSIALKAKMDGFSESVDFTEEFKFFTEHKKLKKFIESELPSAQGLENNHLDNDTINIRDASEREINDILKNVQSKQELFNCRDFECKTVTCHFLASSHMKTLIIRKKSDDGLVKYLLLEIGQNVKIKTTYKTNEFDGRALFTIHLLTSNYSFSVSL